jgi:hypothetical protein
VSLEVNEATGRIRGYFDPSGPTGADLQRPLKDGKEHDATVIAGFREHHPIRMPTRPRSADGTSDRISGPRVLRGPDRQLRSLRGLVRGCWLGYDLPEVRSLPKSLTNHAPIRNPLGLARMGCQLGVGYPLRRMTA